MTGTQKSYQQTQEEPEIYEKQLSELSIVYMVTCGGMKAVQSWLKSGKPVQSGLLNAKGEPIKRENFAEVLRIWDGFSMAIEACLTPEYVVQARTPPERLRVDEKNREGKLNRNVQNRTSPQSGIQGGPHDFQKGLT
jgi:hypothetical protein